jgi:predicted DNA-binding protein
MFKQKIYKSKLMSRTVSARIQDETYEKLANICSEKGITINEYLKECLQMTMKDFDMRTNINNFHEYVEQGYNKKELLDALRSFLSQNNNQFGHHYSH